MNASQELNNLRYSSTKENKDNSDSEEELKPAKRRHGNSVYIHRPARTTEASIFEDNNLDSLRKKHLFIISQYERILRETSDLNKKIEDTTKKVEELTKSLKDIKEKNGIRPDGRMPFSLLCFMPGTPERLCAPRRASCG